MKIPQVSRCIVWFFLVTCSITGSTLRLGATTGQIAHQIIGTCGSATSFAPCGLTSAELPLSAMGTITGGPGTHLWSLAPTAGPASTTGRSRLRSAET
jgi:hypothetical protein